MGKQINYYVGYEDFLKVDEQAVISGAVTIEERRKRFNLQDLTIFRSYLARNLWSDRLSYGCKPKKGDLQYEKYQKVFKRCYGFLRWFLQLKWFLQHKNLKKYIKETCFINKHVCWVLTVSSGCSSSMIVWRQKNRDKYYINNNSRLTVINSSMI